MELELLEKDCDLKLLMLCMKSLEKSFLWRFYSFQTKLKMIAKMYLVLSKLVSKESKKERGENAAL